MGVKGTGGGAILGLSSCSLEREVEFLAQRNEACMHKVALSSFLFQQQIWIHRLYAVERV